MNINNDISGLRRTMQKKYHQLKREKRKDKTFDNISGLTLFETLRSAARQNYLLQSGKSWIKHSKHQDGLAFDVVPVEGKGLKIFRFLWNKSFLYKKYAHIGVDKCGLRNLGISYGQDWYHFELPQVFQGQKPSCFGYVCVNLLQKALPEWRRKTIEECVLEADLISEEVRRRGMPVGNKSALEILKIWGVIKDYRKVKISEFEEKPDAFNRKHIIIAQKRPLGRSKYKKGVWAWDKKQLEDEKGIFGHTCLFDFYDEGKIHCINSHAKTPTFVIDEKNVRKSIQTFYEVTF